MHLYSNIQTGRHLDIEEFEPEVYVYRRYEFANYELHVIAFTWFKVKVA